MPTNRISRCLMLGVFLYAITVGAFAQGQKAEPASDTVAKVPALDAFHEVIYQIWHDAWPKKDAALLQKLLPEVEKGIADIAAAKLPGILREKQPAWDTQVKKIQTIGSDYKAAVTAKDEPQLLSAAEKLHSQYEAMVRVLRPALKELDDFHAVVYMVNHHYIPGKQFDKVKSSAAEMKIKMAALNNAKLPERLKKIEEAFVAARAKLSRSVDEMETAVATNNEEKIKQAFDVVHTNYEMLNQLFE